MPSAATIDILNSLLEAEMNSIFRFLEESSPYLNRATADLRKPLQEMVRESHRHADELAQTIIALGGAPIPRQLIPEEQYLAYLSFNFLLPKLIEAKTLMIQRYQNAIAALPSASPQIKSLLAHHLTTHQADLALLTLSQNHALDPK